MIVESEVFKHPYIYLFLASFIISCLLAYVINNQSESSKIYNKLFIIFAASNGYWSLMLGLKLALTPTYVHLFLHAGATIAASLVIWSWFMFTYYYTNIQIKQKVMWAITLPLPIGTVITLHSYYANYTTQASLFTSKGVGIYLIPFEVNIQLETMIFVYFAYAISGLFLLIYYTRKQGRNNKKQYYLIISGQAILIFAATISFLRFHPYPNIHIVPAFFSLFAITIWKAIYGYEFSNILPVARTKVVENLSQPIIVINDRKQIIDKNKHADELTEFYNGDIYKQNINDVFNSFEHSVDSFKQETQIENFTIKTKNDDDKYYIVTITPLFNNSNIYSGATISFEDITKLKEQQLLLEERQEELEMQKSDLQQKTTELERQNNQLEQFASVLSHDIKNPLNMAQGYASLIKENPDNETYHENLDTGLTRIGEIIDSLLELTQQGKMVTETTTTDLETICEDSWGMLKLTNASLNVTGTMTFESDKQRMQNVFENLFKNSQDHSPEGTQTQIEVGVLPNNNGFYIEDNGPGIPVEKRDDIFEYGVTHSEDGTGLGLSIVEQVVNAHGWEVAIKDAQNLTGVRFEITGIPNI